MDPTVNIEIWGVGVNPKQKTRMNFISFVAIFLPSVENDTALVKNEELDLGIDFPLRARN